MMLATCCAKFCCSGVSTSHTHFFSQTPTSEGPITPGSKNRFMKMACIVFLLCVATAIASPAQSFQTLHGFSNRGSDGGDPWAGLVQGNDGQRERVGSPIAAVTFYGQSC